MCVMSYRKQRDTKLIRKMTAMPVLKNNADRQWELDGQMRSKLFPSGSTEWHKVVLTELTFSRKSGLYGRFFPGFFFLRTASLWILKRITFNCDPFNLPHRHDTAYRGRVWNIVSPVVFAQGGNVGCGLDTHYYTLGVLINPAAMVNVHVS